MQDAVGSARARCAEELRGLVDDGWCVLLYRMAGTTPGGSAYGAQASGSTDGLYDDVFVGEGPTLAEAVQDLVAVMRAEWNEDDTEEAEGDV